MVSVGLDAARFRNGSAAAEPSASNSLPARLPQIQSQTSSLVDNHPAPEDEQQRQQQQTTPRKFGRFWKLIDRYALVVSPFCAPRPPDDSLRVDPERNPLDPFLTSLYFPILSSSTIRVLSRETTLPMNAHTSPGYVLLSLWPGKTCCPPPPRCRAMNQR
jgi:hypothetical protein